MRWRLYFISLSPLFIILIIRYFNLHVFSLFRSSEWNKIKCEDYAFIISIVCSIIALLFIVQFAINLRIGYDIEGALITDKPESLNHEMVGVLGSIVLPFISANFTSVKESLASIFMIIIIGLLSTKSNIYYKNPVLAIFNFKIYNVVTEHTNGNHPKKFDVLCLTKLNKNDSLYVKKIGEGIYYVKKSDHG